MYVIWTQLKIVILHIYFHILKKYINSLIGLMNEKIIKKIKIIPRCRF